jgi:hypothetical protein
VSQTVEPAAPKDPVVHLADTLEEVARSVDHLNVKFKLRVLSTAVEAAILVVVLVLVWQLRGQAQDLTDIAVTNQRNGRAAADTNRILSAVESVTSDGARAASRENSAGLLAEVDCAGRRRQARLPAVTPGACRQNTPPEVYPGIEGEPLRPLGG